MKAWHTQAQDMRAAGAKLSVIAERFNVTIQAASRVCVDVYCPVNHHSGSPHFSDPEWRAVHCKKPVRRAETEDFISQHYHKLSAAEIGKRLGISKNAVIGRARDMGLCRSSAS